MKNKAIFFDRDGVINKDKDHVYRIQDFKFYKGVFNAFKKIPREYYIIVITNQAGIAKGIYKEQDFYRLNEWMINKFLKNKIIIDATYYCPHHANGVVKKYRVNCSCRKPKTGMLKQAEKDFNLDLRRCWVIGDKTTDIRAGSDANCKTILVKTGYGGRDEIDKIKPDFFVKSVLKAIEIINKRD